MADVADKTTVIARTALGAVAVKNKHIAWGILLIAAGLTVGYFWIWGNAIQIQTSEAWIGGKFQGLSLAPDFSLFLQTQLAGLEHASFRMALAIFWALTNQVILFIFSIDMEMHFVVGKIRRSIWRWGGALFIIFNSLADLSCGGYFGGTWQPWAFAGLTFMASFFFGLVAIGLIIQGLKQIF